MQLVRVMNEVLCNSSLLASGDSEQTIQTFLWVTKGSVTSGNHLCLFCLREQINVGEQYISNKTFFNLPKTVRLTLNYANFVRPFCTGEACELFSNLELKPNQQSFQSMCIFFGIVRIPVASSELTINLYIIPMSKLLGVVVTRLSGSCDKSSCHDDTVGWPLVTSTRVTTLHGCALDVPYVYVRCKIDGKAWTTSVVNQSYSVLHENTVLLWF